MPLPLIPLLLGGASLLAAGAGIKKGIDAKEKFDTAKDITERAKTIYDDAKNELEITRKDTAKELEKLGKLKVNLYETELVPFVTTFERIKNIDFTDPDLDINPQLIMSSTELAEIREISIKMAEALGGAAASAAGGVLAGIGALGGATLFGAASTGTAISALSGVAATNATLAWFGGGALAAGGFGMAGGMAVLGGVFAGPVLAVGGFLLNAKAESAVSDAKSNLEKAKGAAEAMRTANSAAKAICQRTEEIRNSLQMLSTFFNAMLPQFTNLVDQNQNYKTYTEQNRKLVGSTCAIAKTIKNIMETPIFDEGGAITKASEEMLAKARDFISNLARM